MRVKPPQMRLKLQEVFMVSVVLERDETCGYNKGLIVFPNTFVLNEKEPHK